MNRAEDDRLRKILTALSKLKYVTAKPCFTLRLV
jgi:hypothetical protein